MPKAKKTAIVHENSFDALPVEQLEPDEPDASQASGANANARHNRSASAQSSSSLSSIQRIESCLHEAITLIDADKHTIEWWATGLSVRLRALLSPARHLATELAQNNTISTAAITSPTSHSHEDQRPSPSNKQAASDLSTGPIRHSLSATDIEAAVARALPAVLKTELARALKDLRDSDAAATRAQDSPDDARSRVVPCCSAHAHHEPATPIPPPLPAPPQATDCDVTISLADVAPTHAVRSLSEAEVKAAVEAALATKSPRGDDNLKILGVKKLASGSLRLRTSSVGDRDAIVKESGRWLSALAAEAQLARDLFTVEIRAVPVSFTPEEACALQGIYQANAGIFPEDSSLVSVRWLRELKQDKRSSSLLLVVDGLQAFSNACYYGVSIRGRQCDVSPYIPSPVQCFFCQGWGHTVTACPRKKKNQTIICAGCAGPHATSACSCPHSPACSSLRACTHIKVLCANCGGNHKSFSVNCPTRRGAAAEVARHPRHARALAAYSSSSSRFRGVEASDTRRSLPFSGSPRAGSAWRD